MRGGQEIGSWEWVDGQAVGERANWSPLEPKRRKGGSAGVVLADVSGLSTAALGKGGAECYACSFTAVQSRRFGGEEGSCVRDCSGHGACIAVSGSCSCMSGWSGPACDQRPRCDGTLVEGKCFVVYRESLRRDDARRACRRMGGHLADVESEGVDEALQRLGGVASGGQGNCSEIWISLNDEEKEGRWEWATKAMTGQEYVNWMAWEPDNGARTKSGEEENGVVLGEFGWRDESIKARVGCFACQFKAQAQEFDAGVAAAGDFLSRGSSKLMVAGGGDAIFLVFAPDMSPVLRPVRLEGGRFRDLTAAGLGEDFLCDGRGAGQGDMYDDDDVDADYDEDGDDEAVEEGGGEGEEEEDRNEDAERYDGDEEEEEEEEDGHMGVWGDGGGCRARESLINSTGLRCERTCEEVKEWGGEEANSACRMACARLAGVVNEDILLVGSGNSTQVVDFYSGLDLQDPARVCHNP